MATNTQIIHNGHPHVGYSIFVKDTRGRRTLNMIQEGWKKINRMIGAMIGRLEEQTGRLKKKLKLSGNLQKKINAVQRGSHGRPLERTSACTEDFQKLKKEKESLQTENLKLVGVIVRLEQERDLQEEELSQKDLELCRFEQTELRLEKKIKKLQSKQGTEAKAGKEIPFGTERRGADYESYRKFREETLQTAGDSGDKQINGILEYDIYPSPRTGLLLD